MTNIDNHRASDSMNRVASTHEYAEDIYSFLMARDKEPLVLYPNYLRWRKPLVQTIFNTSFSFKLETCVLAVNLIDAFASRKGPSTVIVAAHLLGQFDAETDGCIIAIATWQRDMIAHGATQWRALSLLAGTALMVASKYEENQNIQVGMTVIAEILQIHDFTKRQKRRLAIIERIFLQVIDWNLGVPGPLPFLQHFIHERRMRPKAVISGNETNEQYDNHHSNQAYARKRASTPNEALVEVVAESCIRIAMTQHDAAWYDPNVMAGICYQLALYVVQSAKPDGHKDLFTEHDARMIYLASRTKLSAWQVRRAIRTLLLYILNDPFSDPRFCWWKMLPEMRCLNNQLLTEENLHLQRVSRSLYHNVYPPELARR
ncbi:hypothetical protein FOWG_17702 [Fusarium oxysporum f. sp. lycopersici MN25]|nr:hypothetical protein FOWG_17843 [Fusarium oxysporum f. sp. lycopersici MN25]EWZ77949.1 hypothetical protein FOWG_17702 [Fusarium oxysporum f. sp. lycopersici MN25]